MIQLTNETSINKKGEIIDTSWYLVHLDNRNIGLVKAPKKPNGTYSKVFYYGSVKSALKGAIDIVIKDSQQMEELSVMLQRIDNLEERIEQLYDDLPSMINLLRGDYDESIS